MIRGACKFMEPFSPTPSITIQPWTPGLVQPTDPRTIILDPLHAFGTGKHPTTLLCLRIMNRLANDTSRTQAFKGAKVLDFGCGTGLLAIAAVKMGAQEAVGIEIDPPSVLAAKRNVVAVNNPKGHQLMPGSGSAAGNFLLMRKGEKQRP